MATIDRRGVSVDATDTTIAGDPNPGLAVKAPCRVATTGNTVLAGLQSIDGVALAAGDRVLVWQQTDPTTNGLYNASSGPWTRTIDADGNDEWTFGLRVNVAGGASYGQQAFGCTTLDPIRLGTSAIHFVQVETITYDSQATYDTLAAAIAAAIPAGATVVRTLGRTVPGIGGAQWIRLGSTPGVVRSWHFRNAVDGAWWILKFGWALSAAMFEQGTLTNAAVQDALDYLKATGLTGGSVTTEPNSIYTGTAAPVVWDGLILDALGSKFESTISGNGYGLRVGDLAEFRNGWAHSIDGGITGLSAVYGAGISLGETYGAGGVVGAPSYFAKRTRPRLRNVKVSTTRVGGQAIQVMGDVDWDIDGWEVPDSAVMGGAFSADWGEVGQSTVAAGSGPGGTYVSDLERLTAWRNAFNANTVYTTHPRGNIRRGRIGALPRAAGNGAIRLSACHSVTAHDISVKEINGPVINVVGGDFGPEFALADVKPKIYRQLRFTAFRADKCDTWGIFIDTYADNLAVAIGLGYSPLTQARSRGDIIIDGAVLTGNGSNDVIHVQYASGVQILNSKLTGGTNGINVEDQVDGLKIAGNEIFGNSAIGVSLKAVSTIKNIAIEDNTIYGNGTGSSGGNTAGVRASGYDRIRIVDNIFGGEASEASQQYCVLIDPTVAARAVTITGNKVRNVKSGGICFLNGASGSDVLWVMDDNDYAGSEIFCAGQAIIPIKRTPRIAGATGSAAFHTEYTCAAVSMSGGVTPPAGPAYVQGDLCRVPDAGSGSCAIARRGVSTWGSLVLAP